MHSLTQTLRERFSPEGSMLRRQQLRMLEILLEIDRICKKHGIAYWLDSGTLIGAIRHEGFIPWDDDLDIGLMRKDYDRLMKVLPDELPPHLALQSQDTDRNYFFFYAKIRDRRSSIKENNDYDKHLQEKGIFIDVFPFERQPRWIHILSEKLQGHVYKIIRTGRGSDESKMRRVRLITRINARFAFPILKFVGKLFGGEITDSLGIPYHNPRPEKMLFPLKEAKFEGHSLPVPNDSDSLLRLIYGDYMTLPDIEKVNTHTAKITIED